MADNIVKLKVDSEEYESKIKRASQGLQALGRNLHDAGKTFADAEAKQVEFVRELGKMQTVSNTAKGKIAEMSAAFIDLKSQYLQMTDAEKQSPIGQAMAKSLEELKQRTIDAKRELEGLNNELNGMKAEGGKGGGLFGGKGLTDMLSVAGGNLIASGITKLTSELADTVQQSIELAKSGEGIRMAFERLNQPGLLNNLKEATHGTVSELELMKAAVKFDDFKLPVEQLGTLLAFAQKKAKDTGQSVDYMVDSIVTGLGRKSLMILDNLGLSAAQIKERMAETGDMTTAVASIIKDQMSEAGEYVETAADRAARSAADAQNQMEELGRKAMPVAEELGKAWNAIKIGGMEVLTFVLTPIAESLKDIREILSGEYELKIKADIPNYADDDGKTVWSGWKPGTDHTVQAPGGYVEVTDKNTGAVIGGQHFDNLNDANSIKSWQKTLFKTGGKHGPTDEEIAAKITAQWQKSSIKAMAGADALKGSDIKETMSVWATMSDEAKKSMLGLTAATEDLGDSQAKMWDKWIKSDIQSKLEQQNKLLQEQQTRYTLAGQAAQNFGSALAGLEDPAAKAAGTVMQAIASIAMGFAMASSNANTAGTGWGWLAWLAAGTAAMATTISTIHSLTGYAEGGIVKGNSYSGDNVPALVGGAGGELVGLNAGEVVLTQAMQSNLASNLRGNALSGLKLQTKVRGTELLVWLDNSLAQSGRGEMVTWGT
jgi:hypothetical protein